MAGGRPTKYHKKYCEQLIAWMTKGLSFEAFAGDLQVSKQTLYTWLKKHPEFVDAKSIGTGKSNAFWEKIGVAGVTGKLPGFQTSAWIFNMKNRFGWRDKQEIKIDNTDVTPWSNIIAGEDVED
jgi:hypothetical protein